MCVIQAQFRDFKSGCFADAPGRDTQFTLDSDGQHWKDNCTQLERAARSAERLFCKSPHGRRARSTSVTFTSMSARPTGDQ